jgi:hypothetical protein
MRTRYKIGQIIAIALVTLFYLFIAIKIEKQIFRWLFIVLDAFLLYRIIIYYKKCPVFIFSDDSIISKSFLNTRTYYWNELNDVNLSCKESSILLKASKYEATTLKFNNGDKIILWNDTYSNLNEIRKYISEKAKEKIKDYSPAIKNSTIQSLGEKVYKGNSLINLNTILLFGCYLYCFIYVGNQLIEKPFLFGVFILPTLFFFGFGFQMNYFIIDNDSLIIKNHYFPWKKKIFSLNDILEMDIEQPHKRSKSLRILTKDYQSKLYGAGSLGQKNWDELKQDLLYIGIPIRRDL